VRRVVPLTLLALMLAAPAVAASAASLDELLERGGEASYSAEQTINCSTPDGPRDAVVTVAQEGDEIRVGSTVSEGVEIIAGSGGWTLSRGGEVVSSASVESGEDPVAPLYAVEEGGAAFYLGRPALTFDLLRDGAPRARLVLDSDSGAMMAATTLYADGAVYCDRRFVFFDPAAPGPAPLEPGPGGELTPVEAPETGLPESAAGFRRLDTYEDDDGPTFAYYSDGFFSFAVFVTPVAVTLPDATEAELGGAVYRRSFTPGQVVYVWETRDGAMALVGDLPPDLHEPVLAEFPEPSEPDLIRRWWRRLFG